jgi:hypothetical protein
VKAAGSAGGAREKLGWAIVLGVLVGLTALFVAIAVVTYDWLRPGSVTTSPSRLAAVSIAGPEQTVFRWRKQACSPLDIPDLPARALRGAGGRAQLFSAHFVNRRFVGAGLGRLSHPCRVVMSSERNPDPGKFAGWEWIAAPFSPDGRRVYALVHDEFHGNEVPGQCTSGDHLKCWYNGITLAVSSDGGRTFHHAAPPPRHLIASIPYRYTPDGGPIGLFAPSNIVLNPDDGYYYAFVRAEAHQDQQQGACLMRTKTLADPGTWRAWDGSGFSVRFVNPYSSARVNPAEHVCAPVDVNDIGGMTESLTYNTYYGKWLLVGSSQDQVKGQNVSGIYYALSDDLIHWSHRKLIHEVEFVWTYQCGDSSPIAYPSVIDRHSKTRNFATSGRRVDLYFTRLHYVACQQNLHRDLVRVPIRFAK